MTAIDVVALALSILLALYLMYALVRGERL